MVILKTDTLHKAISIPIPEISNKTSQVAELFLRSVYHNGIDNSYL